MLSVRHLRPPGYLVLSFGLQKILCHPNSVVMIASFRFLPYFIIIDIIIDELLNCNQA